MKFKKKEWIVLGFAAAMVFITLIKLITWENAANSFFWFFLFYLVDRKLKANFKVSHYIIIILIISASMTMGAVIYFKSSYFDKILHLTTPFLASFLVFHFLNKKDLKFSDKLLFTFATMIAILAILEIVEYVADFFFNFHLQGVYSSQIIDGKQVFTLVQDRIDDTMIDMVLGFFSSLAFIFYKNVRKSLKKR